MKIISINYLASIGCLALLTGSSSAQEGLRLRALEQDIDTASMSMNMANIEGWWGADGWGTEAPLVGDWSKSAKSGDGSAKASKSEWEGIGEWSKVSDCFSTSDEASI